METMDWKLLRVKDRVVKDIVKTIFLKRKKTKALETPEKLYCKYLKVVYEIITRNKKKLKSLGLEENTQTKKSQNSKRTKRKIRTKNKDKIPTKKHLLQKK